MPDLWTPRNQIWTTADSLEHRIEDLRARGDYPAAAQDARRLLALRESDPTSHPYQLVDARWLVRTTETIATLPPAARQEMAWVDGSFPFADSLIRHGAYAAAIEVAERRVEIRRRHLGESHPDVAWGLDLVAVYQIEWGLYRAAARTCSLSLTIRRELFGNDHPLLGYCLEHLGRALREMGHLESAERTLRAALDLFERHYGPQHPAVATTLGDLGILLFFKNQYNEGEACVRRCMAVRRKLFGVDSPEVNLTGHTLATLLRLKRDYLAADTYLRRAVEAADKIGTSDHLLFPLLTAEQAYLHLQRGQLDDAIALMREVVAREGVITGGEHPRLATHMKDLGSWLCRRAERDSHGQGHELGHEHAEGLRLIEEALAMWQRLVAPADRTAAIMQVALARIHQRNRRYDRARPLLEDAVTMLCRQGENLFRSEIVALMCLGDCWRAVGETARAESLLAEAAWLTDRSRVSIERGPDRTLLMPTPHTLLAWTRLALNRPHDAWEATEKSLSRSLYEVLSARRSATAEALQARSDSLLRDVLDLKRRQAVWFGQDDEMDAQREALAHRAEGELLEAQIAWELLQEELNDADAPSFHEPPDLTRIQATLDSETAIIGYLWATGIDRTEYVAGYVIRHDGAVVWHPINGHPQKTPARERWWERLKGIVGGSPPPEPATICTNDRLRMRQWLSRRPALTGMRQGERQGENHPDERARDPSAAWRHEAVPSQEVHDVPHAFWHRYLAPLMAELAGMRRLVVIPSGPVLGLPIEALPIGDTGDTMADRYMISYAPSATVYAHLMEVAPDARDPSAPGLCLALGDPPFAGTSPNAGSALSAGTSSNAGASLSAGSSPGAGSPRDALGEDASHGGMMCSSPFRSAALDDPALGPDPEAVLRSAALAGNPAALASLRSLPASREEARAVAACHGEGSLLLLGRDASEITLAQLASSGELGRFRTLHLATHALLDSEVPRRSALVVSQADLPDPYEATLAEQRVYDGLIEAREVVGEWRLDADLVTLSACESGLGAYVAGEGYVGLAYGFFESGARALLVSLWQVEDRSTALLMKRFYQNWLGGEDGASRPDRPRAKAAKAEALREAKRWLRDWTDESGRRPYAHPFYWAGFVLLGDPR